MDVKKLTQKEKVMYESHWSADLTRESLIGIVLLVALVILSDFTVKFILRRLAITRFLKRTITFFHSLMTKSGSMDLKQIFLIISCGLSQNLV